MKVLDLKKNRSEKINQQKKANKYGFWKKNLNGQIITNTKQIGDY